MTELTPVAIAHAIGAAEPEVDHLGHGRLDPPPPDRPYVLAYDVAVAGAPARCTVFARFDDEPTSAQVEASTILLRIDPKYEPQTA